MGRGGRAFVTYKFRSMKPGHGQIRGPLWPGCRARLGVRPGISGYAQTEVGYAQSLEDIQKTVWADHYYINNPSLAFEFWIVWRTLQAVAGFKGH